VTVAKGWVAIIESDEWAATLLAKFLRDGGFQVEIAGEARAGFDRIRAIQPDCVLCAVNLPDIDGFWVARRVRAEPLPISATPFVFLTEADDTQSRIQGLNVGADLLISKPFRAEELVAQVAALIEMARRLRGGVDSSSPVSSGPVAFQGELAELSVSTVLTVLELERRTGKLTVKSQAGTSAAIYVIDGALAKVELDDTKKPGRITELLREVLRWKRGTFRFRTTKVVAPMGARQGMSEVLLEAMRLEDESRPKR
jgi:two-component system OmpR family response regulator